MTPRHPITHRRPPCPECLCRPHRDGCPLSEFSERHHGFPRLAPRQRREVARLAREMEQAT